MATRMPSEYLLETGRSSRRAHFELTIRVPAESTPAHHIPTTGRSTPGSSRKTLMHRHMTCSTLATTNQRQGERSTISTPRQLRSPNERLTTPVLRPNSVLLGCREPPLREKFGLSKLGVEGLTKKGLIHIRDVIRPLSASVLDRKRKRREKIKSAKGRQHIDKQGDQDDGESSEE